jgi:hypothetical protein
MLNQHRNHGDVRDVQQPQKMPLLNRVNVRPRQRILRRRRLHRNVQNRIARKDRTVVSRKGRHHLLQIQTMTVVPAAVAVVVVVHRVAVKVASTTTVAETTTTTTAINTAAVERTASVADVDVGVEVVVIPATVAITGRETIATGFAQLLRVPKLSRAQSTEFSSCIRRGMVSSGIRKRATSPRNPIRLSQAHSLKSIVCVKG